jgi:biopolymer transport protein TolQ
MLAFIQTISPIITAPIKAAKIDTVASQMQNMSQSAHAAKPIANHSFSIIDLFLQANFIVQLIMIILLLASIWSWTIIFDKFVKYQIVKRQISDFNTLFHSQKSLDEIITISRQNNDDNPLACILLATFNEWNAKDKAFSRLSDIKLHEKKVIEGVEATQSCLHQTMQLAANRSLTSLEANTGYLATIGNCSPFIGLFGTVWGIMSSFQAIATTQNTSLAVVAPGIAEALLATALGLMAAIPAAFFYNKFAYEMQKIAGAVEDFQIELSTIILYEMC